MSHEPRYIAVPRESKYDQRSTGASIVTIAACTPTLDRQPTCQPLPTRRGRWRWLFGLVGNHRLNVPRPTALAYD